MEKIKWKNSPSGFEPFVRTEFRTSQILRDPLSFSKIHYESSHRIYQLDVVSSEYHRDSASISVFYTQKNT
jgi:hypothetical protein